MPNYSTARKLFSNSINDIDIPSARWFASDGRGELRMLRVSISYNVWDILHWRILQFELCSFVAASYGSIESYDPEPEPILTCRSNYSSIRGKLPVFIDSESGVCRLHILNTWKDPIRAETTLVFRNDTVITIRTCVLTESLSLQYALAYWLNRLKHIKIDCPRYISNT